MQSWCRLEPHFRAMRAMFGLIFKITVLPQTEGVIAKKPLILYAYFNNLKFNGPIPIWSNKDVYTRGRTRLSRIDVLMYSPIKSDYRSWKRFAMFGVFQPSGIESCVQLLGDFTNYGVSVNSLPGERIIPTCCSTPEALLRRGRWSNIGQINPKCLRRRSCPSISRLCLECRFIKLVNWKKMNK